MNQAISPDQAVQSEPAQAESPLHATIKANFNNQVDVKDVRFRFRKVKDDATGIESQRPAVELAVAVPSVEGLIAILEGGGKALELLLEAAADVVIGRAREIVNEKEDITQDSFPMQQLSWEAIANLPKAERRGGGISKEIWESFADDYVSVMPSVTGKSEEQVSNAAKIFISKFQSARSNKPIITKLKEQLGLYVDNSPNAEQFVECVEFLMNKADRLLSLSDEDLLGNL